MKLSSENEEKYWALKRGLIEQIIEHVNSTPHKEVKVRPIPNFSIEKIYIDAHGFPRCKMENEEEEWSQYFDGFSIDEMMIILNSID
jgi:hypothetical protein